MKNNYNTMEIGKTYKITKRKYTTIGVVIKKKYDYIRLVNKDEKCYEIMTSDYLNRCTIEEL